MENVAKIPARPPRGGEIATTGDAKDILRSPLDVWQPYQFGILSRIGGDLTVFERVLQDTEVQSVLAQRRLALVSKNWVVEPASDAPLDVQAADAMRENLEALNWDDINDKMHYGVFYGFSIAELMYQRDGSRVVVSDVKVRERRRFRFGRKGELRLLTRTNPATGEIMPPGKFWTFATGGDNHDNPYGIGLAHWLYWPTYFKNSGIKFWMIFLDKFAMPTALALHEFGDDQVKIGKLIEALEAIHTDSGVAIPKGVEVTLLEAVRSGTTDYATLVRYMDSAIQKVTIGQVASSQGTPGKLGNEDLQAQVREDIIKADADLLCESWNRGPGRWLTAWNFPGATPPKVYREVEPEDDLNERAEREERLARIGFRPTQDHITRVYGEGYEAAEPLTAPGPGPGVGDAGGSQFAAPRVLPPADALEAALDLLLESAGTLDSQASQVIEPVYALVREVGPEKALDRLSELYPTIDASLLTEAVARVNFVSYLLGHADG